jgi:hypothetical protein
MEKTFQTIIALQTLHRSARDDAKQIAEKEWIRLADEQRMAIQDQFGDFCISTQISAYEGFLKNQTALALSALENIEKLIFETRAKCARILEG